MTADALHLLRRIAEGSELRHDSRGWYCTGRGETARVAKGTAEHLIASGLVLETPGSGATYYSTWRITAAGRTELEENPHEP